MEGHPGNPISDFVDGWDGWDGWFCFVGSGSSVRWRDGVLCGVGVRLRLMNDP